MKKILLVFVAANMLLSCKVSENVITRASQYAKMYEEKPATLLIMPPINKTSNVEAKDLLYTSISQPLIEAGYYVIPPLLAMEVLKAESAYDAELFVNAPLNVFQHYFGADAVVFSEIETWTKVGLTIHTDIRYFIKSAYTGEILFDRKCSLVLDLRVQSGGGTMLNMLVDAVATAVRAAASDHIIAARRANRFIFRDIPRGKYSPQYLQDKDVAAEKKDIHAVVRM